MSKKTKTDAEEYDDLKKVGFEFNSPQDEYSYQPDSGSTANGVIGKQEYGIDVVLDAQPYENEPLVEGNNIEDSTLPIPGESEFSQDHRLPQDELDERSNFSDDDILLEMILDQLDANPNLNHLDIIVQVEDGVVTLTGEVENEATKILVNDLVVALPGVNSVSNELSLFSA